MHANGADRASPHPMALLRATPILAVLREIPVLFTNVDFSNMTPADRWFTANGAFMPFRFGRAKYG